MRVHGIRATDEVALPRRIGPAWHVHRQPLRLENKLYTHVVCGWRQLGRLPLTAVPVKPDMHDLARLRSDPRWHSIRQLELVVERINLQTGCL